MRLTQPKVDYYMHWLGTRDLYGDNLPSYDEASHKLLDELFSLIQQIEPASGNGCRTLWFWADRGPIEDFGDAKDAVEDGDFASEQAFVEAWKDYYPFDVDWYYFEAVEEKEYDYRAVALGHRLVIVEDKKREARFFPYDISEFVQWLVDSVRDRISMLQAGTYNDYVAKNLPPQHRTGTLVRSALWSVLPESREKMLEGISEQDVTDFCRLASAQPTSINDFPDDYPYITANDFFKFCALGYAAAGYDGCDRSPRDQYRRNADGRDEGLTDINPDSHEAFAEWLRQGPRGGHPWEVMRGGNSTHVALHVSKLRDSGRFVISLAGKNRTNEVVKFYLALYRAGYPVFLYDAPTFVERLTGTEKIGIVPRGVLPSYCENRFKEPLLAFMNLELEDLDELAPLCVWQDVPPVHLVKHADP